MRRMGHDEENTGEDRDTACGALSEDGASGAGGSGLTDTEVAILELEGAWWKYPGAKEATIYDRFGWTPTRYYQVLNALIDNPAALAAAPVTVNRLRRLRAKRQGQRAN